MMMEEVKLRDKLNEKRDGPKYTQIEEALSLCGSGYNRHQLLSFLILLGPWLSISILRIATLKYLLAIPPLKCFSYGRTDWVACGEKEACEYDTFYETEVSPNYSWTNEFGLICSDRGLRDLFKVCIFGSSVAGYIAFGLIGNSIGRKYPIIIGTLGKLLVLILILFARNFFEIVLAGLLLGVLTSGQDLMIRLLVLESVSQSLMPAFVSYFNAIDGLSILLVGVFEQVDIGWRYLLAICFICNLSFFGFVWYVQESPRFLFYHAKFAKLRGALGTIARHNKREQEFTKVHINQIEDFQSPEPDQAFYLDLGKIMLKNYAFLQVLRLKQYRVNVAVMLLLLTLSFFALGDDVYFMDETYPVAVAICEAFSTIVGSLAAGWWKPESRKLPVVLSLVVCSVLALLYHFFGENVGLGATIGFCIPITLGLAYSTTSMYIIVYEIFPTLLRASALAIIFVFARIGILVSLASINKNTLALAATTLLSAVIYGLTNLQPIHEISVFEASFA